MQIVSRIIAILQQRGIEQQQLAVSLGLQKGIVSDWKKGRSQSYNKHIRQIAEYLEVPIDIFYCDDEKFENYISNTQHTSNLESTPSDSDQTVTQLVRLYNALPLKEKVRALTYIIELSENIQQ